MSDNMQVGKIGWIDMTVDDADGHIDPADLSNLHVVRH